MHVAPFKFLKCGMFIDVRTHDLDSYNHHETRWINLAILAKCILVTLAKSKMARMATFWVKYCTLTLARPDIAIDDMQQTCCILDRPWGKSYLNQSFLTFVSLNVLTVSHVDLFVDWLSVSVLFGWFVAGAAALSSVRRWFLDVAGYTSDKMLHHSTRADCRWADVLQLSRRIQTELTGCWRLRWQIVWQLSWHIAAKLT